MGLRPCLEPGCGRLTAASRCPEHARRRESRRDRRRAALEPHREVYADPQWRRVRRRVLRRDGYRCRAITAGQRCLHTDPSGASLEVHHVRPLRAGGAPYDVSNLVTVCGVHHRQADAAERERDR